MKIKIYTNGEPSAIKPLTPPKQINENINELLPYMSSILHNIKMIPFIDIYGK